MHFKTEKSNAQGYGINKSRSELPQTKARFAFTLAEVLITLGIIGVVAAMTIPTMIENARNRELQVQLKKVYSEWNQISMQFMNDHEQSISDFVADDYSKNKNARAFVSELNKYIKSITKYSNWNWQTKDDNDNIVSVDAQPYLTYNLKSAKAVMPCDASVYGGTSMDIGGKYFSFDDPPKKGFNGPRVCVDLNGPNKPNTFGIDIFSFLFTTDGHVIPEGQSHPDNDLNSGVGTGGTLNAAKEDNDYCTSARITCAYYAINDKSPKGNGTYWKDFIGRKQYK